MREALAIGLILVLLGPLSDSRAQPTKGKTRDLSVRGKPISEWVKQLQAKELPARLQAVTALGQAGPEARSGVAALVAIFKDADAGLLHPLATLTLSRIGSDAVAGLEKALSDPNANVRSNAALTLGLIGSASRSAVPTLVGMLQDKQSAVRQSAALALGRLGSTARSAGSALSKALDDPDKTVAVEAAAALWKIRNDRRGFATLIAACKSPNRVLVTRAVEVLTEIGPMAKSAATALETLLKDSDLALRLAAAVAHFQLSGESTRAFPVIRAGLKQKDLADRRQAIAALGFLAADNQATEELGKLLKEKDVDVRREAASALCERGANLKLVETTLIRALGDPDVGVRWWSALALATGSSEARKREEEILLALRLPHFKGPEEGIRAVLDVQATQRGAKALAQLLRGRSVHLQFEAARALGAFGFDLRSVQDDLYETLKSDDALVRREAANAVAELGAEAIPTLTRFLSNGDARLRESAARALGRMGLPAMQSVAAISRLLKDGDPTVRIQASLALWNIDQQAETALAVVNRVLKDVDNKDRWQALEVIGRISIEAKPAIRGITEILFNGLKDREASVRAQAAKWMWRRVRQAKVIVPLLRDSVTDRELIVRLTTVETLGEMGNEERVVPLLLQGSDDRDVGVRVLAIEGLARSKAVSAMLEAVNGKDRRVRLSAIRALELMGSVGKQAGPTLLKLSKDDDTEIATAAQQALAEVTKPGKGS